MDGSFGEGVQSLYSNTTFTTLIDRFTSLRPGAHFGYKVNQLIKFELLTQSIMAAMPPVGSGPGCPYGLDSLSEWSRVIALKGL